MTKISDEIRKYWKTQSPYILFDDKTLEFVVSTLSSTERYVLSCGMDACMESCNFKREKYLMAVYRSLYRHNDIIKGNTTVTDGIIYLTEESAISELDITFKVLQTCNRWGIQFIKDTQRPVPSGLPMEIIASLETAITEYNLIHS